MDSSKMTGGKARGELLNYVTCFEYILEAAPNKIAVVWPLTSHLTDHLRQIRHAGYCWSSKDELISNVFLWIPTCKYATVSRLEIFYILKFCADTGCCLEDLLSAMAHHDDIVNWKSNFNIWHGTWSRVIAVFKSHFYLEFQIHTIMFQYNTN